MSKLSGTAHALILGIIIFFAVLQAGAVLFILLAFGCLWLFTKLLGIGWRSII